LVVAEAASPVPAPAGWESLREKRYGRTYVTFLRRLG
jgi:16S rRNA G966 N2-methylase RsmD